MSGSSKVLWSQPFGKAIEFIRLLFVSLQCRVEVVIGLWNIAKFIKKQNIYMNEIIFRH